MGLRIFKENLEQRNDRFSHVVKWKKSKMICLISKHRLKQAEQNSPRYMCVCVSYFLVEFHNLKQIRSIFKVTDVDLLLKAFFHNFSHFYITFLKKKKWQETDLKEQTRLLLQITRILMSADRVLWDIAPKPSGVRCCCSLG